MSLFLSGCVWLPSLMMFIHSVARLLAHSSMQFFLDPIICFWISRQRDEKLIQTRYWHIVYDSQQRLQIAIGAVMAWLACSGGGYGDGSGDERPWKFSSVIGYCHQQSQCCVCSETQCTSQATMNTRKTNSHRKDTFRANSQQQQQTRIYVCLKMGETRKSDRNWRATERESKKWNAQQAIITANFFIVPRAQSVVRMLRTLMYFPLCWMLLSIVCALVFWWLVSCRFASNWITT